MFEKDPRTFEADLKGLSPEQKALVKLEITLTKFFTSFNTSITRWERLVYPSLLIMAVLGISGFYLIYHLTQDMSTLTGNVDPRMKANLGTMSQNMSELSQNISEMTKTIQVLANKIDNMDGNISVMKDSFVHVQQNMDVMTKDVSQMNQSMLTMNDSVGSMNHAVKTMSINVADMDQAMRAMTVNTGVMSRDINQLGRPMDFMNSFTPW